MGQVPVSSNSKVLIVGNGRVAAAFFDLLVARASGHLEVAKWHRRSKMSFAEQCHEYKPTHVWIAISDDAISEFAEENIASLIGKTVCHFSGGRPSYRTSRNEEQLIVHATHPLTTFGRTNSPHWISTFDEIPFVLDRTSVCADFSLDRLLPGLNNPVHTIEPAERPYYHALCALAGGLTVMTWEAIQARFKTNLGLDPSVLSTFQNQIFENLSATTQKNREDVVPRISVLTGPVARGDIKMIASHFDALEKKSDVTLMQMYSLLIQLNRLEAARKAQK